MRDHPVFVVYPLTPDDFVMLLRRCDPEIAIDNIQKRVDTMDYETAWGGYINYEIIAASGLDLIWSGVGFAWMIADTPKVKVVRHQFLSEIRRRLGILVVERDLWRIEAAAAAHVPTHNTFLKHLGFEFEFCKRAYGPNREDYNAYAWLHPSLTPCGSK